MPNPERRCGAGRRRRGLTLLLLLASAGSASAQIEAQPLGRLDLFQAAAGSTGLPDDLWRGVPPILLAETFDKLKGKPLSPAARETALALLRTGAAAPEGAATDAALVAARASALLDLGDAAGVAGVLDRTPGVAASVALAEPAVQAALFLGRDEQACRLAQGLREQRDQPFWVRVRAYCDVVAGRTAQAQLALTLMEGQGTTDEPFARLMTALLGGRDAGAPSLRTGLHAALSRRLGLDLAPAVAKAAPAALATLARDAKAGETARASAALRALRLGLIDAEAGRSALAGAPPAGGVTEAVALDGASGTVALHRLTLTDDAVVRDTALTALLRRADDAGETLAAVRLAAGVLPTVAASWTGAQALEGARWAALIPDAALAARLRAQAGPVEGLEAALTDAVIAVAGEGAPDAALLERLAALGSGGDAAASERARAALALLEAAAPPSPSASRRKGEAGLLALDSAAGAGRDGPGLSARVEIVRTLREADLPLWRIWAREGLMRLFASPTGA